jgi:hypothetical protein
MSKREQGVTYQGVLFFDADNLVKEMLYVEFEALLDQVVGMPDFAGQETRACFVQINSRLQIVGAVFFLVDFDQRGYVNRSWNVPLLHLLDAAGRGPDLGAGRIRLSCRSQCSISWHAAQLWDPLLEGERGAFRQMQVAVERNRLGLPIEVEPPLLNREPPMLSEQEVRSGVKADRKRAVPAVPAVSVDQITQQLDRANAEKISALEEAQRLQLATYKSALQEQVDQLRQRHQIQMNQAREAVEVGRKLLREEKQKLHLLKAQVDERAAELQQMREQAQRELAAERGSEKARVSLLTKQFQQQFEVELKARVDQARVELKEMLDMREVELFYREEQLGILREEVARLRQEREDLVNHSGDRLLNRLVESGVAFVAYHPGVEAMTIPARDIPRYIESPVTYVADKCFVSTAQYQQWLSHYDLPVCGAVQGDGAVCGEPLAKIERPSDFLCGESDRCAQHRDVPAASAVQRGH